MKRPRAGNLVAAALLAVIVALVSWDHLRSVTPAVTTSVGYQPAEGDVVFQSLPRNDLIEAIEGATRSPLSHCGVVALKRGRWVVVEAIGPVKETPLEQWIGRGRGRKLAAYRLADRYQSVIPSFLAAARSFRGRPYDVRYRMDDQNIYCSELVYKAFKTAAGEELGQLVRLGDLDWRGHESTIRKYEGGDPPLDRQMITPRDLARATQLHVVFNNGL